MFNLFLKNDNHMISSIKSTARTAGLLYLLQIPLGVFGIIYVPKFLIDKGSLSQTIDNFSSNALPRLLLLWGRNLDLH